MVSGCIRGAASATAVGPRTSTAASTARSGPTSTAVDMTELRDVLLEKHVVRGHFTEPEVDHHRLTGIGEKDVGAAQISVGDALTTQDRPPDARYR